MAKILERISVDCGDEALRRLQEGPFEIEGVPPEDQQKKIEIEERGRKLWLHAMGTEGEKIEDEPRRR